MLSSVVEQIHSPLQVRAETRFVLDRLGSRVGHLEFGLTICNMAGVPASMPFIAFSAIGLKWVSLPGWLQEITTGRNGRKMTRFRMQSISELAPGQSALPCKLVLQVTMNQGCSVKLLPGVDEPLTTLTDVTLYYVAGAGNFAPLRSSIVISADEIARRIGASYPWLRRSA
jgi:hypothetical protein